jgi:hypothetical protein
LGVDRFLGYLHVADNGPVSLGLTARHGRKRDIPSNEAVLDGSHVRVPLRVDDADGVKLDVEELVDALEDTLFLLPLRWPKRHAQSNLYSKVVLELHNDPLVPATRFRQSDFSDVGKRT